MYDKITWRSVGSDQGNAVLGSGALSIGFENEILIGAREARQPVENGEFVGNRGIRRWEVYVEVHGTSKGMAVMFVSLIVTSMHLRTTRLRHSPLHFRLLLLSLSTNSLSLTKTECNDGVHTSELYIHPTLHTISDLNRVDRTMFTGLFYILAP